MIQLGKPSNVENYVIIPSHLSTHYHKLGFMPMYRDGNDIYFIKTKEILEINLPTLKRNGFER